MYTFVKEGQEIEFIGKSLDYIGVGNIGDQGVMVFPNITRGSSLIMTKEETLVFKNKDFKLLKKG